MNEQGPVVGNGGRKCLALVSVPDERAESCFVRLAEALRAEGVRLCTVETDAAAVSKPSQERAWVRLPLEPLLEAWRRTGAHFHIPPDARAAGPPEEGMLRRAVEFETAAFQPPGEVQGKAFYCRKARWWLNLWRVLLPAVRPEVVLSWNGGQIRAAALATVARSGGAMVLYLERGPLPDTLQVDPSGVNGQSAFAQEPARQEVEPLPADAERQLAEYTAFLRESGSSAWGQPEKETVDAMRERLGVPASARVLFFPGQVTMDTNMILSSPHFAGDADVVEFLASLLEDRPDWWLVVKPHPKAGDDIALPAVLGERCVLCPDVHVHPLIDLADLVVTINSSVGIEAALLGAPVVQLGRSLLSSKGVLHEPSDREEAVRQLGELMDGEPAPAMGRRRRDAFFHSFLFEFLYRFDEMADGHGARRLARRLADLAAASHVCAKPEAAFRSLHALLLTPLAQMDRDSKRLREVEGESRQEVRRLRRYEASYNHIMNKPAVRAYRYVKGLLRHRLESGTGDTDGQ